MLVNETKIDVRYAETDQMGVVYHANYLIWFEVGRTNFIKDMGFHYAAMEKDGIVSPVVDVNLSFKMPMRYGQSATVKTWIEHYDGFRVTYGYEVVNDEGEISVIGKSVHICVRKDDFKPIRLRKLYLDWHEAYEKAKKKDEA